MRNYSEGQDETQSKRQAENADGDGWDMFVACRLTHAKNSHAMDPTREEEPRATKRHLEKD
jgi:hypothetical protein